MRREAYFEILLLRCRSGTGSVWQVDDGAAVHTTHVCHTHGTVEAEYSRLAICGNFNYVTHCFPGAGFNGRVNGFTRVDSARPVADQ